MPISLKKCTYLEAYVSGQTQIMNMKDSAWAEEKNALRGVNAEDAERSARSARRRL
jgi:hypothetical protein